jgi:uncharacterized protein
MRILVRAVPVAVLSVLAVLGLATPAAAHVKVSGIDTKPGGYGVLTFRVPTESDTAATTELRVILPEATPIYLVNTQPKPGWTVNVALKDLPEPQTDRDGTVHYQYVTQVAWKADTPDAAIKPHQFDMFNISVGPLPDLPQLALPAQQVYGDGHTVNWDEESVPGEPEPGHPVPVLTLSPGPSRVDVVETNETIADSTPVWPAVAALVVGIVALLTALGNLVLLRRRGS